VPTTFVIEEHEGYPTQVRYNHFAGSYQQAFNPEVRRCEMIYVQGAVRTSEGLSSDDGSSDGDEIDLGLQTEEDDEDYI